MKSIRPVFLLALVLGGMGLLAGDAALHFEKGVAAQELDALFQRTEGWVGGDGVFSVALNAQRTLWLFSDTWVGKIADGKRSKVTLVNNTVGVQEGHGAQAKIDFTVRTGADGKPTALIKPSDNKGWYWILAGASTSERLYMFLAQVEKTAESGAFGFRHFAQKLGVVSNPLDAPANWKVDERELPCTEFSKSRTVSFGSAALLDGEFLYVYGIDEELAPKRSGKRMILARVKADAIADTAAWRYFKEGEWQADFRACSHLVPNVATEYSVTFLPALKKYVAVYTEGGLSKKILARSAETPCGPWSAPTTVFECPEMGWDKNIFVTRRRPTR